MMMIQNNAIFPSGMASEIAYETAWAAIILLGDRGGSMRLIFGEHKLVLGSADLIRAFARLRDWRLIFG